MLVRHRPIVVSAAAIPEHGFPHGLRIPWGARWLRERYTGRLDSGIELEFRYSPVRHGDERPVCVAIRSERGLTGTLLREQLPLEALTRQATALISEPTPPGEQPLQERPAADWEDAQATFDEQHGPRRRRTMTREALAVFADLWLEGERLGVGGARHVMAKRSMTHAAVYKWRTAAKDEGLL